MISSLRHVFTASVMTVMYMAAPNPQRTRRKVKIDRRRWGKGKDKEQILPMQYKEIVGGSVRRSRVRVGQRGRPRTKPPDLWA
ncbi:hypothetical protein EVAR_22540_1 [Eumeta japonica]|uniref:Uncharacterized protein n=1 Tax=Eumeta variegata TaxID=151549 RepID=A0A4C1U8K5_EUMVA|nr:hypothetical protein EVAR_22540_1 [Eumeta japonica]